MKIEVNAFPKLGFNLVMVIILADHNSTKT